jgi:hypothetical protein
MTIVPVPSVNSLTTPILDDGPDTADAALKSCDRNPANFARNCLECWIFRQSMVSWGQGSKNGPGGGGFEAESPMIRVQYAGLARSLLGLYYKKEPAANSGLPVWSDPPYPP